MTTAVAPRQLDRVVPLVVGLTVFAFAAGSSSVNDVLRAGHTLRWVLLVVLLAAGALWSLPRPVPPRGATVAAAVLVALALLSTAWSVEPRTTFERAVSLGVLFATVLVLAAAARGRPDRVTSLLAGVLGGAVAVAVAGILLLGVDHAAAVVGATYESPARYRGFGQDPNTVALLAGVATPIALWLLLTSRRRAVAAASLLLLAGTIVASGSRGGLVSAGAGCLVVVLLASGWSMRGALVAGAVVVAAVAVGAAVQSIPSPSNTSTQTAPPASSGPRPKPGFLNAEAEYPLDADIGQPLPGGGQPPVRRSLFGSSGRLDAWGGALRESVRRPVVGHGFGTEQAVFVDRYYRFVGSLPENSYLGLALQLGIAGLVALGGLVIVLARSGLRALGAPRRPFAVAGLGVLAAGLVAAVVQSYIYSVGNIAALAFWLPAFLLSAVADA